LHCSDSCSSRVRDHDDDPVGAGQALVGTLKGRGELRECNGTILDDASGVVVAVEGTPFTTADGNWQFDTFPAGTYIITLSKSGFGEHRYPNQRFVGAVRTTSPLRGCTDLPPLP